uniref:Uncharacterized protein n=1 Tax=Debaryomyces robertsiae TaxID=28555 RepID=Q707V8_9ASCO|nr:hypothetical protein [Debaryomyces robertsiae]
MSDYELNEREKCLALYGYDEFFKTYKFKETKDDHLLVRGSYINVDMAVKCIEYCKGYYPEINTILVSNNIIKETFSFDSIFYDFHYPNYETYKILRKNGFSQGFVAYIHGWHDLLSDNIIGAMLYSYLLYTKKYESIKHINPEDYLFVGDIVNEIYFFKNLKTIMNLDFNYDIFEEDFNCGTIAKYRNFTKKEIVDNYEIAKCCFENGERSNLVLSKLITCNPRKYDYLLDKYDPFLVYTRNLLKSMITGGKNNKYLYLNICYINILNYAIDVDDVVLESIDIPEYTIYKLAVKYRNYLKIDTIMELYKKNGNKFIKILDMENEKYVYEEISEIPEVEYFDPVKGDELNPYSI